MNLFENQSYFGYFKKNAQILSSLTIEWRGIEPVVSGMWAGGLLCHKWVLHLSTQLCPMLDDMNYKSDVKKFIKKLQS